MTAHAPILRPAFADLAAPRIGGLVPVEADDPEWFRADRHEALDRLARAAERVLRKAEALDPAQRQQALVETVRRFDAGDIDVALDDLATLVAAHPDWIDGHVVMAQLLSQSGAVDAFETFLIDTIRRCHGDIAMASTCLRLLSEAGRHAPVVELTPHVRRWAGDHLFFIILEAIAASETGKDARADRLFRKAATLGGSLSLPHVRHLIRKGEFTHAATIAEGFVRDQPRNQGAWGLLATAWRLTGDTRHEWLAERPGLVRTVDVDLSAEALDALATRLRKLHVARAHPFDQSLRGGTQTAGNLFRRDDVEIQEAKRALTGAVRRYLDLLPPHDANHPLLSHDRTSFDFSDSWSVRLLDGGYHVSHFHPQGVLSSAFYVTLPTLGDEYSRTGWLTLGEPPEVLRTGLPPLMTIEPKVGRLALFPSFMWHGTRPFPQGERMTIAFDTLLGS